MEILQLANTLHCAGSYLRVSFLLLPLIFFCPSLLFSTLVFSYVPFSILYPYCSNLLVSRLPRSTLRWNRRYVEMYVESYYLLTSAVWFLGRMISLLARHCSINTLARAMNTLSYLCKSSSFCNSVVDSSLQWRKLRLCRRYSFKGYHFLYRISWAKLRKAIFKLWAG